MTDKMLRREEVETICGLTRSTIYRLMRKNLFPIGIKVGPRATRWSSSEIESWLAARPRATGETHAA